MSGTESGQVIQDALGLAGHSLKMRKEQLTLERGKEKWVIKNLENVTFSWVFKNTGQFSGLGFFPLAYCVTQGKLSPSLRSFLSFSTEGPTPSPQKVGVGKCRSEIQSDTGNQKLHFVLRVETTPSPPPLPQEEVSPAAQWGRATCFSLL